MGIIPKSSQWLCYHYYTQSPSSPCWLSTCRVQTYSNIIQIPTSQWHPYRTSCLDPTQRSKLWEETIIRHIEKDSTLVKRVSSTASQIHTFEPINSNDSRCRSWCLCNGRRNGYWWLDQVGKQHFLVQSHLEQTRITTIPGDTKKPSTLHFFVGSTSSTLHPPPGQPEVFHQTRDYQHPIWIRQHWSRG